LKQNFIHQNLYHPSNGEQHSHSMAKNTSKNNKNRETQEQKAVKTNEC
jgi:hypothetical protein